MFPWTVGSTGLRETLLNMYNKYSRCDHIAQCVVLLVDCENGCIWNFCVLLNGYSATAKKKWVMTLQFRNITQKQIQIPARSLKYLS